VVNVGPYTFEHDWRSPDGGDSYEAWTDVPDRDEDDWDDDVFMLPNGIIVEWAFDQGRRREPTSARIVGTSRASGPPVIPLPGERGSIVVPQAEYGPPSSVTAWRAASAGT